MPAELDLGKITEIFLVPASILVGALGIASTEGLKTGISLLGLISSALWFVCSLDFLPAENAPHRHTTNVLVYLPILFILCWIIATAVHAILWSRQRAISQSPMPISRGSTH